ncbi:hypothetical protein ACFLSQ_11565, partial [Bacteroidota bacterium]
MKNAIIVLLPLFYTTLRSSDESESWLRYDRSLGISKIEIQRTSFDRLTLRQAHTSTGSHFDRLTLRQAHTSTGSHFDRLTLRQAHTST